MTVPDFVARPQLSEDVARYVRRRIFEGTFGAGEYVRLEQLAAEFPEWSIEKIQGKTGILERHIAGPQECSSDLAYNAARLLFESGACSPPDID